LAIRSRTPWLNVLTVADKPSPTPSMVKTEQEANPLASAAATAWLDW
jgi:hypothetical protein